MATKIDKKVLAYQHVFFEAGEKGREQGPAHRLGMEDLAHFCYAQRTTAALSPVSQMIDPIATAYAEGRRQVYLHIMAMLKVGPETLAKLMEQQYDN